MEGGWGWGGVKTKVNMTWVHMRAHSIISNPDHGPTTALKGAALRKAHSYEGVSE